MGEAAGIVVTVTKDDFEEIRTLYDCILSQTVRPEKWIIVDDSSKQKCLELLQDLVKEHPWIELHQNSNISLEKRRAARIGKLFSFGIQNAPNSWVFCSKIDSDMQLEDRYFEKIYIEFAKNQNLGIASGTCMVKGIFGTNVEKVDVNHTRGGLKTYRRACLESISGIAGVEGWDTIDGCLARNEGWHTKNFESIVAHQSRLTGSKEGLLKTAYHQGRICHYLNYYPPYFFARVASRILKRYPIVYSLTMLIGYYSSIMRSIPKYEDNETLSLLRNEQKKRLFKKLKRSRY